MEIKEVRVQVPLACAYCSNVIAPLFIITNNNEEAQHNNEPIVYFFESIHFSYRCYLINLLIYLFFHGI